MLRFFNSKMQKTLFSFIGLLGLSLFPIMVSVIFGYDRAIISIDTILLYLVFSSKKKFLGFILAIAFITIEIIYGFRQEYPLFNLGTLLDLIPFIRFANEKIIFFGIIFVIIFGSLVYFSYRLIKNNSGNFQILLPLLAVGVLSNVPSLTNFYPNVKYYAPFFHKPIFGSTAYDLYYLWRTDTLGITTHDDKDNFYPLKSISASSLVSLEKRMPKKIIYMIVESWGRAVNDFEYKAQTTALANNKNIKVLDEGLIRYEGGTVQGELRELCGIVPVSYAFASIPEKYTHECLPYKFKMKGYDTVALHGAHSGMYARDSWYPLIGFEETYFYNKPLAKVRKCKGFPGFCDVDLIPAVIERIQKSDRIFFYWMTLNSHVPYDSADLSSGDRSECNVLGIDEGARCNQFLLVKDLFDHLASAFSKSEIHGLEVVLVGDHAPPFFSFNPDMMHALGVLEKNSKNYADQFVDGKVPYIHLQLK